MCTSSNTNAHVDSVIHLVNSMYVFFWRKGSRSPRPHGGLNGGAAPRVRARAGALPTRRPHQPSYARPAFYVCFGFINPKIRLFSIFMCIELIFPTFLGDSRISTITSSYSFRYSNAKIQLSAFLATSSSSLTKLNHNKTHERS